MKQVIKEEIFQKGTKKFRITVEFDGENYIVSGFLDDVLMNQTSQPVSNIYKDLDVDSPEIENLFYLIKDDLTGNEYW